ncbi:MAG: DUF4932 domain-containing protein [Planctomycetes bacterium]|nr:DUF4932 domain-containing protein [Planctomycetota bacterium]
MRRAFLSCFLLGAIAPRSLAQDERPTTVAVRFDPRTELMSVIFRLAGHPEYNMARVTSYANDVDRHFGEFRDHDVVRRARALRASRGVGYDAPMSLAVHLKGIDGMAGTISFRPRPPALDDRWREDELDAFLEAADRFVEETRFTAFLEGHQELYRLTEARLREVLAEHMKMAWFDGFFGEKPRASFTVIPGLLNGGGNYGPGVTTPGEPERIVSVLGVWMTDDEGQPRFDASVVDTVVHEFCHSYCNPIVDGHEAAFLPAGTKLFPYVEEVMRGQAYGTWQIVWKESLVRASTVRYVMATRGASDGRKAIAYEVSRGFEWTPELQALLARYEGERQRYETLEDFVPEIVPFLDAWVTTFAALQEKAPKVVSITPSNGARDVDPAITQIVVTFDRAMVDGGWSVVGGGPAFPQLDGSPRYDDTKTVLTIPVTLRPDHAYEYWLNGPRHQSFRSAADGTPLRPLRVRFRTR